MKTVVTSSSEFGAGVSRLRRSKSAEALKRDADKARERLSERIGKIADKRMAMIVPWWRQCFPKRELRVLFGNGDHVVLIDDRSLCTVPGLGRDLHRPSGGYVRMRDSSLEPLMAALEDVDDITSGYRDGCPQQLVIEPVRRRT